MTMVVLTLVLFSIHVDCILFFWHFSI